jgi:hypothetical protein
MRAEPAIDFQSEQSPKVGMQIEGQADAFVKIRRPKDAADCAKIVEGHIDLRTPRAFFPAGPVCSCAMIRGPMIRRSSQPRRNPVSESTG